MNTIELCERFWLAIEALASAVEFALCIGS